MIEKSSVHYSLVPGDKTPAKVLDRLVGLVLVELEHEAIVTLGHGIRVGGEREHFAKEVFGRARSVGDEIVDALTIEQSRVVLEAFEERVGVSNGLVDATDKLESFDQPTARNVHQTLLLVDVR